MKTLYGKECKYYYGDYFRGHETKECRLIQHNRESAPWFIALCQTCPVPDILAANQCSHLRLRAHVARAIFGLSKKVEVQAVCEKYQVGVDEPKVGCGHCHQLS